MTKIHLFVLHFCRVNELWQILSVLFKTSNYVWGNISLDYLLSIKHFFFLLIMRSLIDTNIWMRMICLFFFSLKYLNISNNYFWNKTKIVTPLLRITNLTTWLLKGLFVICWRRYSLKYLGAWNCNDLIDSSWS